MPDISKCSGTDCPLKSMCYRYTAEDESEFQTYMMAVPFKSDDKGAHCEFFWLDRTCELTEEQKKSGLNYLKSSLGDGYSAGGSGHLSHQSYKVFALHDFEIDSVNYRLLGYEHIIESEFRTIQYTRVDILINEQQKLTFSNRLIDKMETFEDDLGL